MTVYADVLLIINLFVNYVLLLCASLIMKNSASRRRILLGAALGAFYGLVIFLPDMPNILDFVLRLTATCLIVFSTFGFKNLRYFLRCFFTFFAVSFAFGGIMLVLWVTVAPVGMVYNNGAVYFDIDLSVLAISTVVSFALVTLISYFTARRAPRESVAIIKIGYKGQTVSGAALIDTGNSLRESFSGFPVALGELTELKDIIPQSVSDFLEGKNITPSPDIRMVMHTTVSGTGVLPAFKPDYIEVKSVSHSVKTDRVYIAITKNNLAGGEYSFILNPDLLSEEKNYAQAVKKN